MAKAAARSQRLRPAAGPVRRWAAAKPQAGEAGDGNIGAEQARNINVSEQRKSGNW